MNGLDRSNLDEHTVRVIRPAERARPDVRLLSLDGQYWVLKDYAVGAPLFKRLLGAYLVHRERVAYERAAGIAGIPRVIGTLGLAALIVEYVEAEEATTAPPDVLDAEFFDRLEGLVLQLHERGVVHGDLKKLENILVTPDGRPVLVDFTAAFVTGSNPVTAMVFSFICDDDRRAMAKLKQKCAPHLLTAAEEQFLAERGLVERLFRWSRRYVRDLVKVYSTSEHERASERPK
jgi:tRNA A-37 threonylcarbamoyl transferase component Bud32